MKKFCKHCGKEFDLTSKSAITAHLILKLHRSTEHQDIVDRRRTQYETYEERLRRWQWKHGKLTFPTAFEKDPMPVIAVKLHQPVNDWNDWYENQNIGW